MPLMSCILGLFAFGKKKKKTACDLCRDPLQLISASETGVARARTRTLAD